MKRVTSQHLNQLGLQYHTGPDNMLKKGGRVVVKTKDVKNVTNSKYT